MLIRSTADNLKHTLPFIEKMVPMVKKYDLHELCQLNHFNKYQRSGKFFNQDECGVKDETMKEEKLDEFMSNKHKQQMRQNAFQQHNYGGLVGSNIL
jgi:hypothetical protein